MTKEDIVTYVREEYVRGLKDDFLIKELQRRGYVVSTLEEIGLNDIGLEELVKNVEERGVVLCGKEECETQKELKNYKLKEEYKSSISKRRLNTAEGILNYILEV